MGRFRPIDHRDGGVGHGQGEGGGSSVRVLARARVARFACNARVCLPRVRGTRRAARAPSTAAEISSTRALCQAGCARSIRCEGPRDAACGCDSVNESSEVLRADWARADIACLGRTACDATEDCESAAYRAIGAAPLSWPPAGPALPATWRRLWGVLRCLPPPGRDDRRPPRRGRPMLRFPLRRLRRVRPIVLRVSRGAGHAGLAPLDFGARSGRAAAGAQVDPPAAVMRRSAPAANIRSRPPHLYVSLSRPRSSPSPSLFRSSPEDCGLRASAPVTFY